ncbi:potassium voltage-gated channel subfamily A member 2-like isoform X1 [Montipora capricornis]|uniref:potassium voltage-gated channel subfamily A member 2-like isoform X1 n=1 Tax=Montipora capricornis TaxID=246305 RepID=UPI0035F1081B
MLQYHGRPGDLNAKSANSGSSNAHRRGTFALIPPEREKQARPSSESTCQLTRAKTRFRREEKIRINVSGKRYHLTQTQLQRFPESLLADPAKRGIYYDAETEEIFFDRNQTAFESVFNFYATKGRFIFPKRTLSGQLIADELHFFGVYEYLDLEDRKYNLPLPRRLQEKKTIAPRNALQKVLWQMCEDPDSSILSRIFNFFSLLVILFAVFLACVETLPSVRGSRENSHHVFSTPQNHSLFQSNQPNATSFHSNNVLRDFVLRAELFCIVWFTVELLLRFIVAPQKRAFVSKALNIIDFVAVVLFYISLLPSSSQRFPVYILKIIRISRIFQVLKMLRLTSIVKIVGKTANACVSDLWTLVFLTFSGTVLFGTIVYYCEEVDDRTVFRSIPDACWWAVVTITTLGYGDMIPTTFAGKLVGGICCLSGVFLITPLLPIIYNKFDRFQRLEQNKTKARYHYRPSIKVKGSPLVEERVQEFAPVETGQRQE